MASNDELRTRTGALATTPVAATPPWLPEREGVLRETQLGKAVGVDQFGVNHVVLAPGYVPDSDHWHEQEDEFLYVLSGEVVLIDANGEHVLTAGDYAGFPAGAANAHRIANRSAAPAAYLMVGTRHRGRETIHYPRHDVTRSLVRDENGDRVPGTEEERPGA